MQLQLLHILQGLMYCICGYPDRQLKQLSQYQKPLAHFPQFQHLLQSINPKGLSISVIQLFRKYCYNCHSYCTQDYNLHYRRIHYRNLLLLLQPLRHHVLIISSILVMVLLYQMNQNNKMQFQMILYLYPYLLQLCMACMLNRVQ